ncbi:winged helix-turn-helix domain-containing protein [Kutzneria sp. NPDC051319]|uniref:ArsR/SmtB family transcription factor n=1 Tax=Kutzneria sp. NPDC051319 TaxID=3155047 RepID=UPI00342BD9BE
MLRVFFTPEDLARTTISPPQPMWETVLSLHRLRLRDDAMVYDEWRRDAVRAVPPATRMLTDLVPPRGYYADFLTPAASSLEEGVSAMLGATKARLRTDVTTLAEVRPLLSWTTSLGEGRPDALRQLGHTFDRYFADCLSSYWPQVRAAVERDLARQRELLSLNGIGALLADLHPSARWRYPVLEVDYPVEQTLRLRGRGLRLVPSFFCAGRPTTFLADEFEPALVYPIRHEVGWSRAGDAQRSLAALLGPTRARVLEAIGERPCSTSDLARRAITTLPTASRQTSILRSAGLITSIRDGQSVVHSVTPQGQSLLAESIGP